MNTIAYILYLFLTYCITVQVGMVFYKNGRVYLLGLLRGDAELTDAINKLLLTGYYLLNLGYAAWMIHSWETLTTWTGVVVTTTFMTGRILVLLAVIHFFNMAIIFFFGKRRKYIPHHKT